MRLEIACVGKPKTSIAEPLAHYEKLVRRYFSLRVTEVAAGSEKNLNAVEAEGRRLLARGSAGGRLLVLTREGRRVSSRGLADMIGDMATYGPSSACFVIGGALGVSDTVLGAAEETLSLSDLTLQHDVARLVLLEQLYRAGTILRGKPYHKGP